MKAIVILLLILVIAWFGTKYYEQNGLPYIDNPVSKYLSGDHTKKCTTKNGRVIYGSLPSGTECETIEQVKGSLLLVPSEVFALHKEGKQTHRSLISFSCDGRQYCSQMRSCEEARFYILNCPNTRMDGDNDGMPCESQWCN